MQVFGGQDEVVGERAVPAHDAEHRAALAVGAPARTTRAARAAYGVDLTDDASAHERRGSLLDDADELVARDPGERVVPARQLEVGIADAGAEHTHECLARRRFGDRNVGPCAQAAILQPEGPHAGKYAAARVVDRVSGPVVSLGAMSELPSLPGWAKTLRRRIRQRGIGPRKVGVTPSP